MSRKDDVLEMLKVGPVSSRDVSLKLGITPVNAAVLLNRLNRERVLSRTGEVGYYRYELPEQAQE